MEVFFGRIETAPSAMNTEAIKGLSIPLISEQESFSKLKVQSDLESGGGIEGKYSFCRIKQRDFNFA